MECFHFILFYVSIIAENLEMSSIMWTSNMGSEASLGRVEYRMLVTQPLDSYRFLFLLLLLFLFHFVLDTQSHYIALAGLEVSIYRPSWP